MGVDFHWIGTTISSGSSHNGFGKIVSFPSVPAGFPAAGTILETLYQYEYMVAEGGSEVYVTPLDAYYPSQTVTIDRLANGSGGSYLDWNNERDAAYKTNGTLIYTNASAGTGYIAIAELGGGDYEAYSYTSISYFHDGGGSYYTYYNGIVYTAAGYYYGGDGTSFTTGSAVEVPSGSGNYFDDKTADEMAATADGSGGYTWSAYNVQFYSNGTFIYNDGTSDWYWDGSGGFRDYP